MKYSVRRGRRVIRGTLRGALATALALSLGSGLTATTGGETATVRAEISRLPEAVQSLSALAATTEPLSLEITCPRPTQRTVAPGRDFYVLGNFHGDTATVRAIRMELRCGADPVPLAVLSSHPEAVAKTDVPGLQTYGQPEARIATSLMPDLQWDPSQPETYDDPTWKCAWDAQSFTGLFRAHSTGGQSLAAGNYWVRVLALDASGRVLTTAEVPFVIGYAADKVMGRFSPKPHFDRLQSLAKAQGWQVFLDPFPGNWGAADVLQTPAVQGYYAEVAPWWRRADALEYQGGRTHFCIYNVSETSATYNVEVGTLTARGWIQDPDHVRNYYYDLGEPVLPGAGLSGEWRAFAPGDTLEFNRADTVGVKTAEGQVDLDGADRSPRDLDRNVLDGVVVPAKRELRLFGVVTPIANAPDEIVAKPDATYQIGNRISWIEYRFRSGNREKVYQKPVGLTRLLGAKRLYSVLEFAHVFDDPELAGQVWRVETRALDSHRQPVAGSTEHFLVQFER